MCLLILQLLWFPPLHGRIVVQMEVSRERNTFWFLKIAVISSYGQPVVPQYLDEGDSTE